MLALGISGLSRQSTAAIVRDAEILAACEEAKLIGRRSPRGVPQKAIALCLKRAGASASDIETVALDLHPMRVPASSGSRRKRGAAISLAALLDSEGSQRGRSDLRDARMLRESFADADIVSVPHSHALAAFAYYPSGFDRALILTLDSGPNQTAAVAVGEGERIRTVAAAAFPHSPGVLFREITELLGWDPVEDVHRTIWLSTTGEPEFAAAFRSVLAPLRRGQLRLNTDAFTMEAAAGRVRLSEKFLEAIGLEGPPKKAAQMPEAWRANLAASLQAETEAAVAAFAEYWRKKTRTHTLCFGGGVAFNALLADALATRAGFRDGFIPPAAGDAGCAVGAAMVASVTAGASARRPLLSASLGPAFSGQEIKDILDNCRLHYRHLAMPQLIQVVAELLAEGSFVGWFQGAAEFGPRALGNRSILAAPRDNWVKENLNAYTKRRERFRPLAASVTEEAAPRYFQIQWPAAAAYLATTARVKDPGSIPGLAFAEDRARIHVVSRAANKHYHELLSRVGQLTGHPILINTSFNEPGAPLAATPGEALRVFYSSGVDALAIGNFLLQK